ncbi:heme-binding domain-containing protein [Aureivirga sp. CE67]|uniref:heme-binding domain-containing protein n=1 Tax=Aureivirga sp. CE67 TaxID=1788983 RepID=UPI0018CA3941|nr:heme-binding domain-containing protein [Aureivirga sp. CE67]
MKKVFLIVVVVLIGIQLIRPSKNVSEEVSANKLENIPPRIESILKTSCYDCHSNNTVYPWYNNIAPVSWVIANHVNEGKEHLNFDEWKKYNEHQREHAIHELKEVIEENKMPMSSYTILHKNAVLKDKDKKDLLEWINTLK